VVFFVCIAQARKALPCACCLNAADTSLQINDRYEFPDELDLDCGDGKYLSENADRSVRNSYKLHSVLVHSGGVHGGHYYAFIRPDGKRWCKFDDEKVRARSACIALMFALP
jgi:ubiquitin carboxyl-terminal hydrolase 7